MKLGITGTRRFANQEFIDNALDEVVTKIGPIECLVSGGAIGVDTTCEIWAMKRKIPIKQFKPDYDTHGRAAPFVRNKQIVDESDTLVGFPTSPRGSSHGTEHTIKEAEKKGIPIMIYEVTV
jgi:hypothetical protein